MKTATKIWFEPEKPDGGEHRRRFSSSAGHYWLPKCVGEVRFCGAGVL